MCVVGCVIISMTSIMQDFLGQGIYEPHREKVQVGKDQEKAQSEKIPTPKTEVGKKQTNNQVLIP